MSNEIIADIYTQEYEDEKPPFTVFTKSDRFILLLIVATIGFWSTALTQVYFPAIPTITKYFGISSSVLNISVVTFLILQGLAPAVSSSLALYYGLRPVLVSSLLGFVAVCIAISQANAFWLLALLRCLQSALIAPAIAIGFGVLGDVCTRETRGGFIGTVSGFQIIGSGLGTVIGAGLISGFHTWRATFIFLAVGGSVSLLITLFILPETGRPFVGNGSIKPLNWVHKLLILYVPGFRKKLTNDILTLETRKPFSLTTPFAILLHANVFFVLLPAGLAFGSWLTMLTLVATTLEAEPYNYSIMHVGLVYLPGGISSIVGSFSCGKILDWYFKYKIGNKAVGSSALVRARIDICIIPLSMFFIGLNLFGWSLHFHLHIALIYISTIMVSFSVPTTIACINTLLVDMYPKQGHALASCMNMARCLTSALFIGVLDQMVGKMGLGWTYTFLALVSGALALLMYWRFYRSGSDTPAIDEKAVEKVETKDEIQDEA